MLPQISIIDILKLKRKNYTLKTTSKSCYVLTCRIEGESLFFYNNEEHLTKRGDIFYIPSESSYSQKCSSETLICFHLNVIGNISPDFEIFTPSNKDYVCKLFIEAEKLWKQKGENYELKCMAILYELLSLLHICKDNLPERKSSMLTPAVEYLNRHIYDKDLSIEKLCENFHISRTYFNRLFHKEYKTSPITYIHRRRLERAKSLLLGGNFTNEEVASLCGFNDVKYFYVFFKKMTGITTKELIKDIQHFKNKPFTLEEGK